VTTNKTDGTPAADGYRWPAEWEPHVATWLSWPHAPLTWPGDGRLERVENAYAQMVAALHERERVRIVVEHDAREERARRVLTAAGVDPDRGIDFVRATTDDSWIRDCGPIFLKHATSGERLALDFKFDAWGGKYPPWENDDAVARQAAAFVDTPSLRVDAVLEGGAVDGNGAGCVLTTEQCLRNANRGDIRGKHRPRGNVEDLLGDTLCAEQVLWLGEGIVGDDTDGHVDDIARFIDTNTVVAAIESDEHDANYALLADNRARLASMRTLDGKPIDVVELPMPPAVVDEGERLPASYANFLLANGVALVPVFDVAADERALAILRECLLGREVVPIPARDLVVGLGAVHCLSQQEPA
jgi:agmatine deiminase